MNKWQNPYGAKAQLNLLKCLKKKYSRGWLVFWNVGLITPLFLGKNPETGNASLIALLLYTFILGINSKLAFRIASVNSFQQKVLDETQRDKFQPETFSFVGFVSALISIGCAIALAYDLSTTFL